MSYQVYAYVGVRPIALRCAWCKRVVHKGCHTEMDSAWGACDMGQFQPLIIPAASIVLKPKVGKP